MSRIRLGAFLVALILSASLYATDGQHPNVERGFHADQVYSFLGLDTVNVYNGNLNIGIPIGMRYPNGGGSTYGLSLVYNSKLWEWEHRKHYFVRDIQDPIPVETVNYDLPFPSRRFNAGFGWMVTMGRLIDTDDPLNDDSGEETIAGTDEPDPTTGQPRESFPLTYESQDGNDHAFRPDFYGGNPGNVPPYVGEPYADGTGNSNYQYYYTHDDAFLRLRRTRDHAIAIVDFPDGAHHTFEQYTNGLGRLSYRLTSISDAFGNTLTITYPNDLTWVITDQFARQQKVYFKEISNTQYTLQKVVDRIEISAPGGTRSTYYFVYDDASPVSRIPTTSIPDSLGSILVPVLKSIRIPDDPESAGGCATGGNCSTFAFTYGQSPADDSLLTQMTLPTGGRVQWAYKSFARPADCSQQFLSTQIGVYQRTLDNGDGVSPVWTYLRAINVDSHVANRYCPDTTKWFRLMRPVDPAVPHIFDPVGEATTTVVDPAGNQTKNYFSIWPSDDVTDGTVTYKKSEFGMPFTRRMLYPGDPALMLSTELYENRPSGLVKVRSSYVEYESDWTGNNARDENSRVKRQRTVFEDGSYAEEAQCTYVDPTHCNYDYDGYGHFRGTTRTGSGFTPAVTEAKKVNYLPISDPHGSIWQLGVYDYTQTQLVVGTNTRTERQDVCVEPATGFLKGRRLRVDAAGTSNADVVTLFKKGVRGDVDEESWFGGDDATSNVSDLCTFTGQGRKYGFIYDYTNGSGLVTSVKYAGTTPEIFKLRQAVDSTTGLVTSTTDEAGYVTQYAYDALGRLKTVTPNTGPKKGAITEYLYSHGAGVTPRVDVRQYAQGDPSKTLKFQAYEYDLLGRPSREIIGNADGTVSTRTTQYNSSGQKWRVFEPAAPSAFTEFLYDATGRVTSVKSPDGKVTKNEYVGTRQTTTKSSIGTVLTNGTVSDPEQTVAITTSDVLGRLASVAEYSGGATPVTTNYDYDAGGRLIKVVTAGADGSQTRTFTYDGRGFLTQETHPEKSGALTYRHDPLGNVTQKVDNGTSLNYEYDAASRLQRVKSGTAVVKEFFYDSISDAGHAYAMTGRLLKSTRVNSGTALGSVTVTNYLKYDGVDGRLSEKTTSISNGPTFTQTISTDDLGLPDAIHYPWCSSGCGALVDQNKRDITLAHFNGFLTLVSGYASSIKYHPNGMVKEVLHSTGVKDTIDIDAANGLPRPKSITFDASTACAAPVLGTLTALATTVAPNFGTDLSLLVTGTVPMTVEWLAGGTSVKTESLIVSGTTLRYKTPGLTANTTYSVRVTNACDGGSVTSNSVAVTVASGFCDTPVITTQPPSSLTVVSNANFTLTAAVTGTNVTYQWYKNGTLLSGAQSATLSTSVTANATFYVRVTSCGTSINSDQTTVSVVGCTAPPTPTLTPTDQISIPAGRPLTLTASATSGTFTWYSALPGHLWTSIPSATSNTLTVAPTTSTSYKVSVNNGCGSAESVATVVNVDPAVHADFDDDKQSDLIWYLDNGQQQSFAVKKTNGEELSSFIVAGSGSGWHPAAIADIDGDARPDVIWHNDDFGDNIAWKWNGLDFGGQAFVLEKFTSSVADWRLVAGADWDGDHKEDLIFRNYRTGQNQVWLMNNLSHVSTVTFESETDVLWKVQGVHSDGASRYVAWRNSRTGASRLWSNVTPTSHTTVTWAVQDVSLQDIRWKMRGLGDYDGDGKLDLLWYWDGPTGSGLTHGQEDYSSDVTATDAALVRTSSGYVADPYAHAEGVGRPNDCSIAPTVSINANKAAICNSSSVTLTASGDADSYVWSTTATGNTLTVSTPGTYSVTASTVDGCSTSVPFNVIADTLPAPTIAASPALDIASGDSVVLTASAGKTYSWSPGNQTSPSITVSSGGSYHVSVTNANGCTAQSADSLVTIHPRRPAAVIATASGSGSSWSVDATVIAASGAGANISYIIQRSTNGVNFATVAAHDTGLLANTTYFYRALAHDSTTGKDSLTGPIDIATTVQFVNDPLIGSSNLQNATPTIVRAADVTSLRTAIGAMRTAAGLGAYTWTAGTTFVNSAAVVELRTALNQALDRLVLTDPSLGRPPYTEPDLTANMPVRAIHLQQLRDRVK